LRPELRLREEPSNLITLSLIVVLGGDPELTERCRRIAAKARALLREVALPFTRSEIAELEPLVIVLRSTTYEQAPWGYEVLAERVGASLLLVEPGAGAPIVLEYRLREALAFAARLRARVRQ
jgi:hypothetical protein